MGNQTPIDLLQGTLDMLVLKAVSLGPLHGYGVLLRIQQLSRERLEIHRVSVPRTVSAGARRMDLGRVGTEREQPARTLLSADGGGRRRLEAETKSGMNLRGLWERF